MEAPAPKPKVPVLVRLNDREDIEQFIEGLKTALAESRSSGGIYSAFAHQRGGAPFQVEIQVPFEQKKAATRG